VPFDTFDRSELLEHFYDHAQDFGCTTAEEYEAMADGFWARDLRTPPLYECIRDNGMVCRYDCETQEYSVKLTWGFVATYFKPKPGSHFDKDSRPPDFHEYSTNMKYFEERCD
jgi:hypothetical protein